MTQWIGTAGAICTIAVLLMLSGCPVDDLKKGNATGNAAAESSGTDSLQPGRGERAQSATGETATLELTAKGMHCDACETAITTLLSSMEGVKGVSTDYKTAHVTVNYDTLKVGVQEIIAAVEKLGYTVSEDAAKEQSESEAGKKTEAADE
jgi:copper chaperone CopZ